MALRGFWMGLYLLVEDVLAPIGSTPEFERERGEWLDGLTRENILDSLTQLVRDDCPRKDNRWQHKACFSPEELVRIKSNFITYSIKKGGLEYWNQASFLTFLKTQIPESSKASLLACSKTLYSCTLHFAYFPFQSSSKQGLLTYDAFVRSLAFLLGYERRIFENWIGKLFMEHPQGTQKSPKRMAKELFRSFAVTNTNELDDVEGEGKETDDNVLDLIFQVQPTLNQCSSILVEDRLREHASKLSSWKASLENVVVEKEEMVMLLEFLGEVLDGIAAKDGQSSLLARKVEVLKQRIEEVEGTMLSFRSLESAGVNGLVPLQQALKVVFGLFVQSDKGTS